jgi:multiple antibiotic resistance protein
MQSSPFLKAFISLFVAIDAFAALPFLVGLTHGMSEQDRRSLIHRATGSALAIGLIFVLGGKAIFSLLGITESDFRIAGGLLLIIFAIHDLLSPSGLQGTPAPTRVGIVPIAVPLMMGPAALTTLMVGTEQFGTAITIGSLVLNLLIIWQLFTRAQWITNHIGEDAGEAVNKVFSLLLAAIGVMLVRSGVLEILHATL